MSRILDKKVFSELVRQTMRNDLLYCLDVTVELIKERLVEIETASQGNTSTRQKVVGVLLDLAADVDGLKKAPR